MAGDGEVIQFVPKVVPKEEAPKPEPSTAILSMAKHLRNFADKIESGEIVAVAVIAVDKEGTGLRGHQADRLGISLVGMAAKLAHTLADRL
jgi:hypothetical protein